jgi:serine/threonine-protein kinase
MSPEQVNDSRNVDGRSDIWSLGVILWEMLTGEQLFGGETTGEVFSMILCETPAPPSAHRDDVDPELDDVVLRCLEPHRADRFTSARELMCALAPFATERARSVLLRLSDRPPPASSTEPVSVRITSAGAVSATSPTLRPPKPARSDVDDTLTALDSSGAHRDRRWRHAGLVALVGVAALVGWRYASAPSSYASPASVRTSAPAPQALPEWTQNPAAKEVPPEATPSVAPSAAAVPAPSAAQVPKVVIPTTEPVAVQPPKPAPQPAKTTDPLVAPPGMLDIRE